MAFGVTREELNEWKAAIIRGEIAFLTHYWRDDERFPGLRTVTKVGCSNLERLASWCRQHGLNPDYIHRRAAFPHFDLIGAKQLEVLRQEGLSDQIVRFKLL
ncbi:hypothetical protein [Paenibacillus sp. GCM10027626]|uniref:hypothetical protein n=1 Tax=Paenibacillus sp. GCM10027626 TaxID=3273411 RepID=UPI0036263A78